MKIPKFKAWLVRNGAQLHDPTNPYEALRFESRHGLGLVYINKHGFVSSINAVAQSLWESCAQGLDISLSPVRPSRRSLSHTMMELLSLRDGWECFYCGATLTPETCTGEHLCPKAHGGPNHPSNMVLACEPCNQRAGNLPIVEKLKLRTRT